MINTKYKNENLQKIIILEGFRQNGHYHRNQLMKARRGEARRRGEEAEAKAEARRGEATAAPPRRPRGRR